MMIYVLRLFVCIVIVAVGSVLCEENVNEKTMVHTNDIELPQFDKDLDRYAYKTSIPSKNSSWPLRIGTIKYNPYAERPYALKRKPVKYITNIIRAPSRTITEKVVASPTLSLKEKASNEYQYLDSVSDKANILDWFLGIVGIHSSSTTSPSSSSTESSPKHCPKCTCGKRNKQTRIVGGIETQVNDYPWVIYLTYGNRFYCGATLINNKYILTAAHCVNGFSRERITAVLLDHDRSVTWESKTMTRKIKNIYRHRGYATGGSFNNDIALLQMEEEVPLTGILRPVCLPPTGKSFTGYEGIATGWGAIKEHGQVSNKLREVKVPIMSNIDCKKTGYKNRITDNMICAGYSEGQKDSCQGDSGGPLHVVNNSIYQIVGIVSWGEGCAQPNYPGVYTRVNRYISWIKSNTKDACYC